MFGAIEPRYIPHWWMLSVVRNMIVRAVLPAADLLDVLGFRRVAQVVYHAHDRSAPKGGG